jgi:protoheme IX farnesyltransferase
MPCSDRVDAAPPVLGWVAVTHSVDPQALVLFMIIFMCTLIPAAIGMSGLIYLAAALALDARFLHLVVTLQGSVRHDLPMRTFRFSITYLMALFGAFIADHYCRLPV